MVYYFRHSFDDQLHFGVLFLLRIYATFDLQCFLSREFLQILSMQPTFCDALVDHAAERYESHQTSDFEDNGLQSENLVSVEDTIPQKGVLQVSSLCYIFNKLHLTKHHATQHAPESP